MRSLRRVGAVIAAALVMAGACGGGNEGDVDAYCDLVIDGVGFGASSLTVQEAELAQLLEVAPPEIRDTVLELSNTTRRLDDIEEIDQLFDAVFDPEAQAAKDGFEVYAVETCGLDESAFSEGGSVNAGGALVADIRAYVEENFEGAAWAPKVRYEAARDGGDTGLTVTFIIDARDDEAMQACAALSVYLYELRDGTGAVIVMSEGEVVARRDGPAASCETP